MKRLFLAALLLLAPSIGWGQNTNTMPPMCAADTLLTTCVPQVQGTLARISDGTDATVCTNSGAGSTTVTCQFNGTSWLPFTSGSYVGANADTITNAVDGQFLFTRAESGAVTITCADFNSDCELVLQNGGTHPIRIGEATVGTTQIEFSTQGLNVFIDEDGNTMSLQGSDANSVILDFRDYGDTTDDDMAHAILDSNCTTTTTGAEECNLNISITTGGANVEVIALDPAGGIEIGDITTTAFTIVTDGGNIGFDGTITMTKDLMVDSSQTATFGAPNELFTNPSTRNQILGIPKLNVTQTGGAMPDGTATAEPYNPLIASCAPTNGSEAAGTFRVTGAASYQYTGAGTAAENDGFDCDVTGHAVNGTDSIGFWFRSDTALTAGTLDVSLLDLAVVEANADMPAVTVVNEWQWIEVDFDTDCNATCADIDGVLIAVTAAGAATSEMDGTIIHIDSGAFWLVGAEEAIGDVRVGGVISVSAGVIAGGSTTKLVEYTDYIVNYQTGADALVILTDQSSNYGTTLEALN